MLLTGRSGSTADWASNRGQSIYLALSKKKQAGRKIVGLLVNVWFRSAVAVTLKRVEFESRRSTKTHLMAGVETTLRRTGSVTLLQLCQNYMYLCVRIGNNDRLRPPSNA